MWLRDKICQKLTEALLQPLLKATSSFTIDSVSKLEEKECSAKNDGLAIVDISAPLLRRFRFRLRRFLIVSW